VTSGLATLQNVKLKETLFPFSLPPVKSCLKNNCAFCTCLLTEVFFHQTNRGSSDTWWTE
jgi:hypothetical protein